MTKDASDNVVTTFIAGLTGLPVLGGLAAAWPAMTARIGYPLSTLVCAVAIIAAVIFFVVFVRYIGILSFGGASSRSRGGTAYADLRQSLVDGGLPARLYSQNLSSALNAVDVFFGDDDAAHRTLFLRALGLKTPVALWTAPAFDRCILLAFVYPVAMVILVWTISGHVGPAEAAFSLASNVLLWRRYVILIILMTLIVSSWNAIPLEGWRSFFWLCLAMLAAVMASVVGAGTIVPLLIFISALAVSFGGKSAGSGVITLTFGIVLSIIMVGTISGFFVVFFADVIPSVALMIGIALLYPALIARNRQREFLLFYLPLMVVLILIGARFVSLQTGWSSGGPLFLFLGLLTLLNAPFDWISLGLTRALLRRGVELEGWWPYLLAIVDGALAVLVIALLACTMIVGVQTYDLMAVFATGKTVLPLGTLFDGITHDPGAPEYWWVYSLLLSTMFPSLINLVIGGASLTRGIPGLSRALLRRMPADEPVADFDRNWIALVLASQWLIGTGLGVGAQAFLMWAILGQLMPILGFDILDMARSVAALDLPLRVCHLFI